MCLPSVGPTNGHWPAGGARIILTPKKVWPKQPNAHNSQQPMGSEPSFSFANIGDGPCKRIKDDALLRGAFVYRKVFAKCRNSPTLAN